MGRTFMKALWKAFKLLLYFTVLLAYAASRLSAVILEHLALLLKAILATKRLP